MESPSVFPDLRVDIAAQAIERAGVSTTVDEGPLGDTYLVIRGQSIELGIKPSHIAGSKMHAICDDFDLGIEEVMGHAQEIERSGGEASVSSAPHE